jgi:tartrate-resistant acid phosphatase type 5
VVVDQFLKYSNLKSSKKISNKLQLAWIKKDLAATKKYWKFVILHKPGWSAGTAPGGHDNYHKVQQDIQPLLEKYHVTALFSGHNHIYSRALVNGVHHITTGGGGARLHGIDPSLPNIISAKKAHHYCKVQINNDIMTIRAVEPNGSVIASFMHYKKN